MVADIDRNTINDTLWTVADAAAALRLGRSTVYRMYEKGILPGVKLGSALRFVPEVIADWVLERTTCAHAPSADGAA